MKKNIIIVVLLIVVLILAWFSFSSNAPATSVSKYHYALGLSVTSDVTCTYPQTLYSSYQGDKVTHELPPPETNPIIITFSDFYEEISKAKFIDSTQTISEVPLVKIVDTPEKFIFIEGSGDPYVTVHTIYKDSGIATFAKSISFLGTPVGSMAMGTCADS